MFFLLDVFRDFVSGVFFSIGVFFLSFSVGLGVFFCRFFSPTPSAQRAGARPGSRATRLWPRTVDFRAILLCRPADDAISEGLSLLGER